MLIHGHASASDEVIDEFYGKLKETVPSLSTEDITLVNRDFKNNWREKSKST